MFSSQILNPSLNILSSGSNHSSSISSSSSFSFRSSNNASSLTIPSCSSLKSQEIPVVSQSSIDDSSSSSSTTWIKTDERKKQKEEFEGGGIRDEKGISGIRVPRQRYIFVSKKELLESLLSMFESQQQIDDFLQLSSCLDSIIHAEHKSILEEMRIDYSQTDSVEKQDFDSEDLQSTEEEEEEEEIVVNGKHSEKLDFDTENLQEEDEEEKDDERPLNFNYGLDLSFLLGSSFKKTDVNSGAESRIAVATRFQRAFMKLLHNAQFEELSARDLLLTSALNTDYLLTLPIYVDWKRALESNAIIFRRGYATERQNGLLLVEKLDYLQSKLLQGIFFTLAKPVGRVGMYINEALKSASQTKEAQVWIERVKHWFKEPSLSQQSYSIHDTFNDQLVADQLSDSDLPIWLAAQRAVPRYEGLLSSAGPRGRLLRKLLTWIGVIPSVPEASFELDSVNTTSELYARPIFLSRISLGDLWRPATRERCGNVWNMLKTAVSILFSQSVLQEPAFQELILLYTEEIGQRESRDKIEVPSLKLKIYERIPIPDLPVIFPHKKLSFRILDTVRLDVASIVGLLAFLVNYKFENIVSSPSAFLLDAIAFSALVIYVSRVALGYKQTWDRYQLLVNRTLYEKTLASGFGSVHFLLDASEQQQYKEAILAYAVLLQAENRQMTCHKSIGDACERFLYDKLKEKVEMPVDNAMDTLLRLGLVTEASINGNISLRAIPCSEAYVVLKQRWNSLLG
ncbi:Protein of unknown function DUF3754 [Macleaya cordata]|uniref:DUF3754 domain-containing protein n=1 Tax=Macleaya cordata TaxID=56857 RepID=A0A200PLJ4_MACCD|nr:Protein of unknown function DUF3754 [Macleaya cordata]